MTVLLGGKICFDHHTLQNETVYRCNGGGESAK